MTKPGPKPKPTSRKLLAGNPGRRPLNEGEPSPKLASPRVPSGLSDDAKRFWRKMARELIDLRVLTVADVPAFILMSEHFGIARRAAAILAEEGLTTEGDHGLTRKHPALQILRDNSTAFRLYASEFGLTPSSRSRVGAPLIEEQDDFLALLFSRRVRKLESSDDD